jgi:zinc protease
MDALPIRRETLANGLSVVLLENRAAPVAAIQVWVDVGSADERDEQGGIAHVHEHMLFKGTERRAVGEIAAEVEASGGDINAWTSLDSTVYHVVMASRFFDSGLDILSDALLHSAFDPGELERELEVILEEIKRSEDQPASRVSRALFGEAFSAHPYRRPVIGHAEVVSTFTREQILDFYGTHYRPDQMTVVAVGDFDPDDALTRIDKAFSKATPGSFERKRSAEPKQTNLRACGLSDDVQETQLAIGWHGPSIREEELFAVDVMSVVLGSGRSSRLSERVRYDKQLVNEIYAYAYTPRDPGLVVVGSSLSHERLDEAIAAIGHEVQSMRDRRVGDDELSKAKAMLSADTVYQRETVEGLARRFGYWNAMVGDPGFEDRYQEGIANVTADDVRAAAERVLTSDGATIVALAPKGEEERVAPEVLKDRLAAALKPRVRAKRTSANDSALVTLDSGARVVIEPDHTNPIVTLRGSWLGGLRSERPQNAGYGHLVGEMLVRGNAHKSASEIATQVDRMASHIEGFAGRNSFGVRGTFLSRNVDEGVALLSDCLRAPAFAEGELDRVRTLALEDLKNRADNPAGLAFDLFNKSLWLEHPYREDQLGNAETLKAVTPDALRGFYSELASASGAVVAITGDITVDSALPLVEELLDGLPGESAVDVKVDEEPPPDAPRVARLERDRAQAHLVLGHRGLSLMDEDRYALEVMCSALSGQGGRLFLELRDKQSLCYAVSAFSIEGLEPGSFCVYMATSPDKVERALGGIESLLAHLCDDGISEAELQRAQRYLIGTHDIGLQRLGARAAAMALNELYGLGWDVHKRYSERVEAVTLERVRAVAQRVLAPATRVTSIVAPEGTSGPEATLTPRGVVG